jgi:dTDP-4-amino-4,6-dideoxygalactose transaminase
MARRNLKLSKQRVSDLALFGGRPAFEDALHVGRPNIGNRRVFRRRVDDIMERHWLTNGGPYVDDFERRIAKFTGVKHCIATSNATVALEIAIRALGMTGEVIVPSFTFVATVHALQWQGITPVFCDIDPATHNIDPGKVAELITSRTSGILAVHLWGRPCPIAKLQLLAKRRGLALLFDAAHAFASKYRGCTIGGFGEAEVLSFHATKFINAGEGGAVVTNNDDLASRSRLMTNFGFSGFDKVISIGTNAKMSELSAALGLTNLESIGRFSRVNRGNFELYGERLSDVGGVSVIGHDQKKEINHQYVVVEVDAVKAGLTRDQLLAVLQAENVLARRYFYPGVHRMDPYRLKFPNAGRCLLATEAVADRVLVLPTGTGVTRADIRKVCAIIRFAIAHSGEIQTALAHQLRP